MPILRMFLMTKLFLRRHSLQKDHLNNIISSYFLAESVAEIEQQFDCSSTVTVYTCL